MKGKKLIIILIIINILSIGVIYNFIKKDYLSNEKIIIKAMTSSEYENYITSLNQSHTEYSNHIQESKTKIASAITDMGITTSDEETLENMANNIRNIPVSTRPEKIYSGNFVSSLDIKNFKPDNWSEYTEDNFLFVPTQASAWFDANSGAQTVYATPSVTYDNTNGTLSISNYRGYAISGGFWQVECKITKCDIYFLP